MSSKIVVLSALSYTQEDNFEHGQVGEGKCGVSDRTVRIFDDLKSAQKELSRIYGLDDRDTGNWGVDDGCGNKVASARLLYTRQVRKNGTPVKDDPELIAKWKEGKAKIYDEDWVFNLLVVPNNEGEQYNLLKAEAKPLGFEIIN